MTADVAEVHAGRPPLYVRLLRLRHLRLRAWQRAVLGEGVVAVAVLLALADLASAWAVLVLPVVVAVVVKAHDTAAGLLQAPGTPTAPVPQDRRRQDDEEED